MAPGGLPQIIFGAGGIGGTVEGSRNSFTFTWDTPEKVSALLSTLSKLGIKELDSAGSYPPGNPWNTETLLGQAGVANNGFIVDSKIVVNRVGQQMGPTLTDENISFSADKTLGLLGVDKIRTMYAHAPDPNTPLGETAKAFDRQYRAGKFEKLGLSNFTRELLQEYFDICEKQGYVKPTVYQGQYNALVRDHEKSLIPLLRDHGCVYNAYSPLAGGFLTGKVTFASAPDRDSAPELKRTRWAGASTMSFYPDLYDKPKMHAAIRKLADVCAAQQPAISLTEASLRWIMNHSTLGEGDGIIVGAKREEQFEASLQATKKGPLPETVVRAFEEAWIPISKSTSEFGKW